MTIPDYKTACRLDFAAANGWRLAKHSFTLQVLERNGVFDGTGTYQDWPALVLDHAEFYRRDRRAVAIVAHNYAGRDLQLREWLEDSGLNLTLHCPSAGKRASWYYPNGTLPMCLTRPGIDVLWPTEEQMAETERNHAIWTEGRRRTFYRTFPQKIIRV